MGEVYVAVIYINFYINSKKMFSYLIPKTHYGNKKKINLPFPIFSILADA